MIEFYPSKLDGAPCETYPDGPSGTIESWLLDNVPTYSSERAARVSARLNGRLVPHDEWSDTAVTPADLLQFYAEPKGAELIIAAVTLGAALTFVTGLFTPKLPKPGGQGAQAGDRLASSTVKGNQVRLNSPIREVAGRRWIYPDYILPPHRYFAAPREQVVELLLCVGVGEFDIPLSQVLIGDTPAIALGDVVDFSIYGPGASLAGKPEAVWWHSAPEVGATSSGTAGMELTVTAEATPVANAQTYVFSGDTVTVPSGAGELPDDWASGMIIRIEARFPFTVVDGGGGRDVITGDIAALGLAPGDLIEIVGENEGDYIVETVDDMLGEMTLNYSNGSPATALQIGAVRMGISFRGLRYRITAASTSAISLGRLTDTGATDAGWPGFPNTTIPDAVLTLDASTQEGGWLGPFRACPDGETTTRIEWDIFAPGGLIYVGNDGWVAPPFYSSINTFTIEIQWRDAALAGAWTSVIKQYSGKSTDQIGFTESVDLPYAMQPEVRARRVGAKPTRVNTQSTLQWYGLRSRLSAPTSYAGVTTMTLRVGTSDTLASQSESLVGVRATRILPTIPGPVEPTRNPADWVRYVAHSVGYTDSDLDMDELERLHTLWASRGDWYDDSLESNSTVLDAIGDALRVGFAVPTIEGGVIRPVRDEPRTVYDDMYSPQNMTGPLRRGFAAVTPDDPDGVDVEYLNETTKQWETVPCRLPDDLGVRVEKMRVPGVSDRTRAWRIGMRRRRELAYRRKTFQFDTEMDALNSGYLGFVALGDDVPGYSQSGIVEEYAVESGIAVFRVSEMFDWTPDATHIIAVRRPDGTLSGPYVATRVSDFLIDTPEWDFTPVMDLSIERPHVLFGESTRWAYGALIDDISPRGTTGATVAAVNYDERVYLDDDNAPP